MTATVSGKRIISSGQEFEELFSQFGSYTDPSFRSRVCEIIGRGGCVVVKRWTGENHWDGSLTIRFPVAPTAREVIKIVRDANSVDDFGMSDDKTLWLWWD